MLDIIKPNNKLPETEGCQRIENMICALTDDLLLQILRFVPTKDAVATSILSKVWRCVWTMLPELEFKDEGSENLGWFIEKTLQLHKAPIRSLIVKLGPRCSVDVDVGRWVEKAVNRRVAYLEFRLLWTAEPIRFPKSLYTCDTLRHLTLSNQILVDVSSPASLPSLLYLNLEYVVYKDEDSFVRLLSSSPVLETLWVKRHEDDNLKNVTVKVPSLQELNYISLCKDEEDEDDVEEDDVDEEDDDDLIGSLVIDSPALTDVDLANFVEVYCLIKTMPCLNLAFIGNVNNPDDKFLRCLSSVIHLHLSFTKSMVAITYPRPLLCSLLLSQLMLIFFSFTGCVL